MYVSLFRRDHFTRDYLLVINILTKLNIEVYIGTHTTNILFQYCDKIKNRRYYSNILYIIILLNQKKYNKYTYYHYF